MAKASIIIALDRRTRFLRESLDSALAQTYLDFEVITVADGPTAAVREVVATYGSRIRYIPQEQCGPAAARNTGARVATGEYLLFMDNDDRIDAQKLSRHIAVLDARREVQLTYSRCQMIDEHGRALGESAWRMEGILFRELVLHTFCLPTVGLVVMRREAFERAGGFVETLTMTHDYDLWLRLANAGVKFTLIDALLTQYRVHRDSLTNARVSAADNELRVAEIVQSFSTPGLRPEFRALASRAVAVARAENAARCYRDGDAALGRDQLQRAAAADPSLCEDTDWWLEFLAGSAADPRTAAPTGLIDAACDDLPVGPVARRSFRRRAHARYHCVAAFAAYQRRDWAAIRGHARPALRGDPSLLLNRGFASIALRALARMRPAARSS